MEKNNKQTNNECTGITKKNLKNNYNWGNFLENKIEKTTKIHVQNTNGIGTDNISQNTTNICQFLQSTQSDIILLQEHSVDKNKNKVKTQIKKYVKSIRPKSDMQISTSPIIYKSINKTGGAMQGTIGNLFETIVQSYKVHLCRWNAVKYTC